MTRRAVATPHSYPSLVLEPSFRLFQVALTCYNPHIPYSEVLEQREPLLESPSKSTSDLATSGVVCPMARTLSKLLNSLHQRHHPHPRLSRAAAWLISGNRDTSPSTLSVSTTTLRTHTQVVLALALGDQDYTAHRV